MNPVLFTIGPFTVYWYSALILTAFIVGYVLVCKEGKKEGISINFLSDMFFYLVPIVIIGARIYYVIFEWQSYQSNPLEIFAIWHGGLAIHGGIIAGILFAIYYTKKKKVNTLKLFDMIAPVLILGQAIGRWGNFFNQEAYGPATTLEVLKGLHIPDFVVNGMFIRGTYYHPTFLYESIICFLGFFLILWIRSRKKVHIATPSAIYFIIYGTARFFIESLRQDSLMLGTIKVAQLVSLCMVLAGIGLLIYSIKFKPYYHGKENLDE